MHVIEDSSIPSHRSAKRQEPSRRREGRACVHDHGSKEGTPLLRYRTRDHHLHNPGRCSCGRTLAKIHRLFGARTICSSSAASNVFPSQIEHALIEIEGTDPNYVIVLDRGGVAPRRRRIGW
jgi:phenylacetate-CoA ligase